MFGLFHALFHARGAVPATGAGSADAARALVEGFEGLGDNCEFGLVQRYCGAEPLGLFRFSAAGCGALTAALDADLAPYGEGADLTVFTNPAGTLTALSRAYGFAFNTTEPAGEADPSLVLARERTRVAYLRRRLLEDLAAGEKILVRKAAPGEGVADARALAAALARHGPGRLLWVRAGAPPAVAADPDAPNLILGTIPRFAPPETAYAIDLPAWIALLRLARGAPATDAPARADLLAGAGRGRLRRPVPHVAAGRGQEVFGAYQRCEGLDPARVHAFSVWVWLPEDFSGERVGAAIGHYRLGWADADLALRARWQRVWVAARVPAVPFLNMGLVVTAAPGARLWSTGRRLEAGPVPGPAEPPRPLA